MTDPPRPERGGASDTKGNDMRQLARDLAVSGAWGLAEGIGTLPLATLAGVVTW